MLALPCIICIVLLRNMVAGLTCAPVGCTTHDNSLAYQRWRAILIRGTVDGTCCHSRLWCSTTISLKSEDTSKTILTADISTTAARISYPNEPALHDVDFNLDSKHVYIVVVQDLIDSYNFKTKVYWHNGTESKAEYTFVRSGGPSVIGTIVKSNLTAEIVTSPCQKDLSLSFCTCKTPVITNLHRVNNTVRCEGSGYPVIDDALSVSWLVNGTPTNSSEEKPEKDLKLDTIVSELKNISVEEYATNYTCMIYNRETKKSATKSLVLGGTSKEGWTTYVIVSVILAVIAAACVALCIYMYKYHPDSYRRLGRGADIPEDPGDVEADNGTGHVNGGSETDVEESPGKVSTLKRNYSNTSDIHKFNVSNTAR